MAEQVRADPVACVVANSLQIEKAFQKQHLFQNAKIRGTD